MSKLGVKRAIFLFCVVFVFLVYTASAGKKKENASGAERAKLADSGSFGIYVDGKRVATETFRIEQSDAGGVATSEFTTDFGTKVHQSAELRIASNGDLRRYEWHESAPGKSSIVVEPSEEFLLEHITPDPPDKPTVVTVLLPTSSPVLDDYFYSHREILIWRYLAQSCGQAITSDCSLPKTQFGVLVPRQRTSATLSAEYSGKQKVTVKGTERVLDRFIIDFEGDQWACYLDEKMRLIKVEVPSDRTEVIRD